MTMIVLYRTEWKGKHLEAGIIDYMKTKGLNEDNCSGNGGGNRYERWKS